MLDYTAYKKELERLTGQRFADADVLSGDSTPFAPSTVPKYDVASLVKEKPDVDPEVYQEGIRQYEENLQAGMRDTGDRVPASAFQALGEDRIKRLGGSSLGALARSVGRVPENLVAKGIQAVQGTQGADAPVDKGWADKTVDWVENRNKELSSEYFTSDKVPLTGGLLSKRDLAEFGPNLAYSGATMAGSALAGTAGTAVSGNPAVGVATGMAAGGALAARMTGYQVMNDWLAKKNEDSIKALGRGISSEEAAAFKKDFTALADKSGLFEAGPEAVGNALELALMRSPLGKLTAMLPDGVKGRLIAAGLRVAGTLGAEGATETVTQMGQQQIESEAGVTTNEKPRDWANPDDWLKSAREVLPQVLLLTGAMSGTGAVYRKLTQPSAPKIATEPGKANPAATQAPPAVTTPEQTAPPFVTNIEHLPNDTDRASRLASFVTANIPSQALSAVKADEASLKEFGLEPADIDLVKELQGTIWTDKIKAAVETMPEKIRQQVTTEMYHKVRTSIEAKAAEPAAVEATGAPESALRSTAKLWDQQNRTSRSDAWFEGGKVDENARQGWAEAMQNGGDQLQAHGMGKELTLQSGIDNLLNMFDAGLDPSRRGGKLDTAPLVAKPGEGLVGATASGSAYNEGPFVIVMRPGAEASGRLEGAGAILVNESHADIVDGLRAELHKLRPDILVEPYSSAGKVATALSKGTTKTEAKAEKKASKTEPKSIVLPPLSKVIATTKALEKIQSDRARALNDNTLYERWAAENKVEPTTGLAKLKEQYDRDTIRLVGLKKHIESRQAAAAAVPKVKETTPVAPEVETGLTALGWDKKAIQKFTPEVRQHLIDKQIKVRQLPNDIYAPKPMTTPTGFQKGQTISTRPLQPGTQKLLDTIAEGKIKIRDNNENQNIPGYGRVHVSQIKALRDRGLIDVDQKTKHFIALVDDAKTAKATPEVADLRGTSSLEDLTLWAKQANNLDLQMAHETSQQVLKLNEKDEEYAAGAKVLADEFASRQVAPTVTPAKAATPVKPAAVAQPVDAAKATKIDTEAQRTEIAPTEAQIKAGNYKKGHIKLNGLDISVENPHGSTRSGTDPEGKKWETTMTGHYGYFRRTEGKDGDHVDVVVAPTPDADAPNAYIVDQVDPKTGKFDEHKIIMGVNSKKEADTLYHSNYEKGWKGAGAISEIPVTNLKEWLSKGKRRAPYAKIDDRAPGTSTMTPKRAKAMQAYTDLVKSLAPEVQVQVQDLIVENPESPSNQTMKLKNKLNSLGLKKQTPAATPKVEKPVASKAETPVAPKVVKRVITKKTDVEKLTAKKKTLLDALMNNPSDAKLQKQFSDVTNELNTLVPPKKATPKEQSEIIRKVGLSHKLTSAQAKVVEHIAKGGKITFPEGKQVAKEVEVGKSTFDALEKKGVLSKDSFGQYKFAEKFTKDTREVEEKDYEDPEVNDLVDMFNKPVFSAKSDQLVATGMSRQNLAQEIMKILGTKKVPDFIKVRSVQSEIDADILAALDKNEKHKALIKNGVIYGITFKNKIYLIAESFKRSSQVMPVLVHEAGHFLRAFDTTYSRKYDELMKYMQNSEDMSAEDQKILSRLWDEITAREKGRLDRAGIENEVVMNYMQHVLETKTPEKHGFFMRLVKLFKNWVYKTFNRSAKELGLTTHDIAKLMIADLKLVAKDSNKYLKTFDGAQQEGIAQMMTEGWADNFYSKMQQVIQRKLPNTGTPQEFKKLLKLWSQSAFKAEEYAWSGLAEWLDTQEGAVTKQQVMDFLNYAGLQVRTGQFTGEHDFQDFTLPGGAKYTELLFYTRPRAPQETEIYSLEKALTEEFGQRWLPEKHKDDPRVAKLQGLYALEDAWQRQNRYTHKHWGNAENVMAHMRFDEREDDGGKFMHIAEVQSDLHQQGLMWGYADKADPSAAKKSVPDLPYKKTWPLLVMKQAVRWAAENGYYKVTWDAGSTQTERYGTDAISWKKVGASFEITHEGDIYGGKVRNSVGLFKVLKAHYDLLYDGLKSAQWLAKYADKLWARMQEEPEGKAEPRKEGLQGFYDKRLVNDMNDFFNKAEWGRAKAMPDKLAYMRTPDYVVVQMGSYYSWVAENSDGEVLKMFETEANARNWAEEEGLRNALKIYDAEGFYAAENHTTGNIDFIGASEDDAYAFVGRMERASKYENAEDVPVWSLPVTPEMTQKALHEGMPLFAAKQGEVYDAKQILRALFGRPETKEEAAAAYNEDLVQANKIVGEKFKDPAMKTLSKLTKRLFGHIPEGVQQYTRDDDSQTTNIFTRIFSLPEYYLTRDNTAAKVYMHAERQTEIKYTTEHYITGEAFAPLAEALQKKDPASYEAAQKYLLDADKMGRGYSVRLKNKQWHVISPLGAEVFSYKFTGEPHEEKALEAEAAAVAKMTSEESKWVRAKGFSEPAVQYIKEFRDLTNRGFEISAAEMRRQIKVNKDSGLLEPQISYVNEEKKREVIPLSVAIAKMGELRGTYFPRERPRKKHVLIAKKPGQPNILIPISLYLPANAKGNAVKEALKSAINANLPVRKEVQKLIDKGYKAEDITIGLTKTPSDVIFDTPGLISAMDTLFTAAEEQVESEDMSEIEIKQLEAVSQQLSKSIGDIYKAKGSLSSRMKRAETPWEGHEEDPTKAAMTYAQRLAAGVSRRTTARNMLEAFTGRDVSWADYKSSNPTATYKDYRSEVRRKAINSTTQKNLYDDVRTYMTHVLRPDTQIDRFVGYLKGIAVLKYLGLRVSSAAVNATNMALAAPATIAAHTGLSITESWGEITRATAKYLKYRAMVLEGSNIISRGLKDSLGKLPISQEDKEIFDIIAERGWDEANFNQDSVRQLQSASSELFNDSMAAAMYMFGAVEKSNRATTIFAAYKAFKKADPAMTQEEALMKAQHASNRTHGVYGKAAKPWLVQKVPFLDLPYTFSKFSHNYVLNMIEIGAKYPGGMKNVPYMLIAPAILAGAGTTLVTPVLAAILKVFGLAGDDPEEEFYTWAEENLGSDAFMRHGLAGLANVNLKGSLQMSMPDFSKGWISLTGAPGGVFVDLWEALKHAYRGEGLKALEKAMPTAGGSLWKGWREYTEGVTTSDYAPVFYDSERLKGSKLDFALRVLAFNPGRLSGIRQKQWKANQVRLAYQEERSRILSGFKHLLMRDPSGVSVEDYADLYKSIQDYNESAVAADPKYVIPSITGQWLQTSLTNALTPDKYERRRE